MNAPVKNVYGVEVYEALGWDLQQAGTQLLCHCPFCSKHKMYVSREKATYDCKVCGARGNANSVLSQVFDKLYRRAAAARGVDELAEYRGMPAEMFEDESIGYDETLGWVFMIRRWDGAPTGLRRLPPGKKGKKRAVMQLGGTRLGIFGHELVPAHPNVPVYICEGEWDTLAMRYLMKKMDMPGVAVGVAGATNFTKEQAESFMGRDVVLLYDNDKAGKTGLARTAGLLRAYTKRVRFIEWPLDKPDGYDVHDLIKGSLEGVGLLEAQSYLAQHVKPYVVLDNGNSNSVGQERSEVQAEEPMAEVKPVTVEECHATFKKWLLMPNCDLLDIAMGCAWSTFLPGSPLWMLIVAPPSSAKSETLIPLSSWQNALAVSTLTPKSVISGFQLTGGVDPSLLARLDGRIACVVVKDLTPLLQGAQSDRDEVFGILRDAYDGSVNKVFGNGVKREYTRLNFSLIAGVTPAIDAFDSVSMGERFLKFRSDRELDRADDLARAERAVANSGSEDLMRAALKAAALGCLARDYRPDNVPQTTPDFVRIVSRLALFCARARATATVDKWNDVQSFSPIREAPPRLALQFTKLAKGLALHYGTKNIMDKRIIKLIRRVAIHTPDILTMRLVQTIFSYEYPCTLDALRGLLPTFSNSTLLAILGRLGRTGVIESGANRAGKKIYYLAADFADIIDANNLFDFLPPNDPLWKPRGFIL